MGREGDNDDDEPATHDTLSFAEFAMRGNAPAGSERAVLVVAETGGGQQVFPLNRNPTVIGRSNNADLVLPIRRSPISMPASSSTASVSPSRTWARPRAPSCATNASTTRA